MIVQTWKSARALLDYSSRSSFGSFFPFFSLSLSLSLSSPSRYEYIHVRYIDVASRTDTCTGESSTGTRNDLIVLYTSYDVLCTSRAGMCMYDVYVRDVQLHCTSYKVDTAIQDSVYHTSRTVYYRYVHVLVQVPTRERYSTTIYYICTIICTSYIVHVLYVLHKYVQVQVLYLQLYYVLVGCTMRALGLYIAAHACGIEGGERETRCVNISIIIVYDAMYM